VDSRGILGNFIRAPHVQMTHRKMATPDMISAAKIGLQWLDQRRQAPDCSAMERETLDGDYAALWHRLYAWQALERAALK
jgi:hypothetical protein